MRYRRLALVGLGLLLGAGAAAMDDVEVTIYGRFKWDACFNRAKIEPSLAGNYIYWVADSLPRRDRSSLTVRDSRLGLDLSQGENLTGKVEVDFFGEPDSNREELEPTILLRHAYLKYKLNEECSITIGQTDDVFAPLSPEVLNYGSGSYCGNVGYRRSQFRFEYAKNGFVGQLAYAHEMQARLAYELTLDGATEPMLTIGVSGLNGERDTDRKYTVRGYAADVDVALGPRFSLRGEYYSGRNLADHNGAIGQGLRPPFLREIDSDGWWAELGIRLTDEVKLNLGYSMDDPEEDDLQGIAGVDDRDENTSMYINILWRLNERTQIGLEASGWETLYTTDEDYFNARYQFSFIYEF